MKTITVQVPDGTDLEQFQRAVKMAMDLSDHYTDPAAAADVRNAKGDYLAALEDYHELLTEFSLSTDRPRRLETAKEAP